MCPNRCGHLTTDHTQASGCLAAKMLRVDPVSGKEHQQDEGCDDPYRPHTCGKVFHMCECTWRPS